MKNGVPKRETQKRVPKLHKCDHVSVLGRGKYERCDVLTAQKAEASDGRTVYICPLHIWRYR